MGLFNFNDYIAKGKVQEITLYNSNKTIIDKYRYSHTVGTEGTDTAVLYQMSGNSFNNIQLTSDDLDAASYYSVVMRGEMMYSEPDAFNPQYYTGLFSNDSKLLEYNSGTSTVNNITSGSKTGHRLDNMFDTCTNLTKVTFNPIFTSNYQPTNMESMFYGCTNLNYINLSMFNTNNGTVSVKWMFLYCTALQAVAVTSDFVIGTDKPTDYDESTTPITNPTPNLQYIVVPEEDVATYNQDFGKQGLTLVGYKNSVPIDVTFTYDGGSASFTFDVEITAANDAPTGINRSYTITEGSTLNVNLLSVFSDVEDPYDLSYQVTSGPANVQGVSTYGDTHTARISDHTLVLEPSGNNYYGQFTVVVQATDPSGGTTNPNATLTVTVTNTVTGIDFTNLTNTTQDLSFNSNEGTYDTVANLDLTAIFSDDGTITKIEISTDGTSYTDISSTNWASYNLTWANYNSGTTNDGTTYSATLRATDSLGSTDTQDISVNWTNTYSAINPVITANDITIDEGNATYTFTNTGAEAIYTQTTNESISSFTVAITSTGTGSVTGNVWTLPSTTWNGTANFSVYVTDSQGEESTRENFTVTVNNVNNAPLISLTTGTGTNTITLDAGITKDISNSETFNFNTGNGNYTLSENANDAADGYKVIFSTLTNISTINSASYDTATNNSLVITNLGDVEIVLADSKQSGVIEYQISDNPQTNAQTNSTTFTLTIKSSRIEPVANPVLTLDEDTPTEFLRSNLITVSGTSAQETVDVSINSIQSTLPQSIDSVTINSNGSTITITPKAEANTTDANFVPPLSAIQNVTSQGTAQSTVTDDKFTNRYIL
jgi:hypothetical protein